MDAEMSKTWDDCIKKFKYLQNLGSIPNEFFISCTPTKKNLFIRISTHAYTLYFKEAGEYTLDSLNSDSTGILLSMSNKLFKRLYGY